MTTRSRLSSGIRTLCGGLPDEPLEAGGLPEYLIYEVLTGVETQMLIDINLSDQNRRVKPKPINLKPNETDFALNASDFSQPSFAQLSLNPSDPYPIPVDTVNLSSVLRAGQEGRYACAIYGNPVRIALSWIPQSGDYQTLTLWYDRTIDIDGALSGTVPFDDAYTEHLKLQSVAQCMELLKQVVGEVLKARIAKGERQWEKYVRMSASQGLVSKPSSHPRANRMRYGRFQRPGGGFL